MMNFPIAFVLAFGSLLLAARVLLLSRSGRRGGVLLAVALMSYVAQSLFIGLRWGYQAPVPWVLQIAVALAVPVLTWAAIDQLLASGKPRRPTVTTAIHLASVYALCGLGTLWPPAIDVLITVLYIGYGAALLVRASAHTQWAEGTLASSFLSVNAILLAAGLLLIGSTMIDFLVAADLALGSGTYAADIVGVSNIVSLLLLSLLLIGVDREPLRFGSKAVEASTIEPPAAKAPTFAEQATVLPSLAVEAFCEEPSGPAARVASLDTDAQPELPQTPLIEDEAHLPCDIDPAVIRAERLAILKRVDEQMMERKLYRDPNLTLNRIARKLVIPSRQISSAINSERAVNVSQYVNTFRVCEAQQLLAETDTPISQIVFEVGFQTKSNFNREFQRICGISPSAWRAADRSFRGVLMPQRTDAPDPDPSDAETLAFLRHDRRSPSYG